MVRAEVKVVTADTGFTPDGLAPVSVPPGATVRVPLSKELGKALADGALGVSVEADEPLTASLLTTLDGDRVLTVPAADVTAEAATLIPVATGKAAKDNPVRGPAPALAPTPPARPASRRTTTPARRC